MKFIFYSSRVFVIPFFFGSGLSGLSSHNQQMITDLNQHKVEVILSNEIGYERIAMDCSATFAKIFGCPADRIEDLKTVVAEAAMNAIQHGNRGRANAKVKIFLDFNDDTINVAVIDEGNGIKEFPPKPDIARIIDNIDPPIGLGLFLIEQLADRVEFIQTTNGSHVVKLTIKFKRAA
jgi:serine/threonine-protein kinase RsbW